MRATLCGLGTIGAVLASSALAQPLVAQRVADIVVSPATLTLAVHQRQPVFATAYDVKGNVIATAKFSWRSEPRGLLHIEPDTSNPGSAIVVGVRAGVAQLVATAGGRSGSAAVQVTGAPAAAAPPPPPPVPTGANAAVVLKIDPNNVLMLPGESRQLTAQFLKADGTLAVPSSVTWHSLNPTVVTVTPAGVAVATAEGQAAIQVNSASGLTAVAPVQVAKAGFGFAQPVLSMSPGRETTLQVLVPTQNNRSLANSAFTWFSSDTTIVRVTQLGVARAVGPGSAEIMASGFLQERRLPVRVHRPVTALEVLPRTDRGPILVPLSGTLKLSVKAMAADETPVPDAPIDWKVADPSVVEIAAATQTLSGKKTGSTTIEAAVSDAVKATWTVRVVAGGLLLSRERVGLGVGDTVRLAAQFTDSAGTPLGEATGLAWRALDPKVATVTDQGLVTAAGSGLGRVVASTPWGTADTLDTYVEGALLFTSTRAGGADLYALDPRTPGAPTRLTTDSAADVAGAYSPDGSRIAFVSTRDGNPEIYVMNADGSAPRRLTKTPQAEDGPQWTPDGKHIVFASQRTGHFQIWIMNADGSNPRQLTQEPASNSQPAVSPDGGTIAFTSTRDRQYEVYLMNADGSHQRNLTQSPAKEWCPAWFPDGDLGYVLERNAGGKITAVVIRRHLASAKMTPVSPADLLVTGFAVAPAGDLLALQVSAFGANGSVTQKIQLLPLANGATPSDVPRQTASEQQSGPSFRPRLRP